MCGLQDDSEDGLRVEMRRLRDIAVTASNAGLPGESRWFDDRLQQVKQKIAPLAEQRQERIMEQSMTDMGY